MQKNQVFKSIKKKEWNSASRFKAFCSIFIATVGGVGFFPIAPGTLGTLVGIACSWMLQTNFNRFSLLLLLIGMGTWAIKEFNQMTQSKDHPSIVIDEVVGILIATLSCQKNMVHWVTIFFIFRFFDIFKIFPVNQVESWAERQTNPWTQAVGVIGDDIVAGLEAYGVMVFLEFFQFFPFL